MKRNLFVFLLSLLSLNLFCQVHWTKHPDNPVMVATEEWEGDYVLPRSVIYHDSIYHMWYWGATDNNFGYEAIGYAISPDGINWTKDTNNPVLEPGPEGAWDDHIIHGCSVILHDSIFHMWYNGHSGQNIETNWGIGHATSPDGINWSRDTTNPVMVQGQVGEWDELEIELNSVIHDGDNFQMWYDGIGYNGGLWCVRAGHAISPDGVNWMEDSLNPVLIPEYDWEGEMVFFLNTVFDGFNYKMWYAGGSGYNWQVGYATSDDGSVWEKYGHNPVLKTGSAGSWDQKHVGAGPVIDSASVKYKMWYIGGQTDNSQRIGYAESDTRIPYFTMESKSCYRTTDTVVAEIALAGVIYIVPDGTPFETDSIIKHMLTSVEVSAYSEVQILLTDLSYGRYNAIAVSNEGFVSANPYHFNIVESFDSPKLEVENEMVTIGDSIFVTSDVDATIYLMVRSSIPENPNSPLIKTKLELISNDPVGIPTIDLAFRKYYLVAMDDCGFVSEAYEVSIEEESGIVNKSTGRIIIFPNPANDLLTVKTHEAGTSIIKISSLNGQLIYRTEMEGSSKQIDMTPFSKGIYFITVRSDAWVRTEKVVKL